MPPFPHRSAGIRRLLGLAAAVMLILGLTRVAMAPSHGHLDVAVVEPTTASTLGILDTSSTEAAIPDLPSVPGPSSTILSRRPPSVSIPATAPSTVPHITVPITTVPSPSTPIINQPGIYVIRIDGSGLRRLAPSGASPSWAPNGQEVAYQAGSPHAIAVVTLAGVTRILPSNPNGWLPPEWSPDSSQIVYAGPGPNWQESDPWIVATDGLSQARQVAVPGDDAEVAWGSNNRIASTGSTDIATFNPDGSNHQVVSSQGWSGGSLSWSPDALTLLVRAGGSQLLIGADGSNPRYLGGGAPPPAPPPTAGYLDEAQWAPDSHQLVYYESPRRTGHSLIWVAPADGSPGHVIAQDMEWPDWSPTGNLITAAARVDAGGWFHDLDVMDTRGGNLRALLHSTLPAPGSLRHPVFSPDGQMIVFEAD